MHNGYSITFQASRVSSASYEALLVVSQGLTRLGVSWTLWRGLEVQAQWMRPKFVSDTQIEALRVLGLDLDARSPMQHDLLPLDQAIA